MTRRKPMNEFLVKILVVGIVSLPFLMIGAMVGWTWLVMTDAFLALFVLMAVVILCFIVGLIRLLFGL